MASHEHLPPASSPTIILATPTDSERQRIWRATYPHWGAAVTIEEYVQREIALLDAPLARNGGLKAWMLTDGSLAPDNRPILSSFETYKKRALVSDKGGAVKEVVAYGVASVFTFEECRKKGYAGKMMALFAEQLRATQQKTDGDAAFSVLWSDIGKDFYNSFGWKPFQSTYLEFPTTETSIPSSGDLKLINFDDLPSLTTRDESLLRSKISQPSSKSRAVILPDLETLQWHLIREDYMCKHIFSCTPSIRGAVYTPPNAPNSRVWAIWSRAFYGGLAKPEKNTLYFLRLVIEDETISDEELAKGIQAIVSIAQTEAQEWKCAKAEIWNPPERVKKVAEGIVELGAKFKVRESTNLGSLQWFGEGSVEHVDWVASEKYAWC
ncbi:hypothetical protein B0J13DRAFT_289884 [Dactylonectria estremocensis]|uniref:LYC1 C-terminal domain-containing protein n=1 Tax=Dactylonectria estremocensis TaxID=1079267 RepID=A0A9P9J9M2_9HYPO|nr:hypothetical protein B0J13DRAFT_289884 [Dactylonectria estremocensis]